MTPCCRLFSHRIRIVFCNAHPASSITIKQEKDILGSTIDEKKLIDQVGLLQYRKSRYFWLSNKKYGFYEMKSQALNLLPFSFSITMPLLPKQRYLIQKTQQFQLISLKISLEKSGRMFLQLIVQSMQCRHVSDSKLTLLDQNRPGGIVNQRTKL